MLFAATWWFVWLFNSNKIPYTETPNMHSITSISHTVYYIQYNPPSILKSIYYTHNMHRPFDFRIPLSTEAKVISRSKRFLSESSPSVGRRIIKFHRVQIKEILCQTRFVPSGLVGTRFLARNVPFSRFKEIVTGIVPSVTTDRIGKPFLSRNPLSTKTKVMSRSKRFLGQSFLQVSVDDSKISEFKTKKFIVKPDLSRQECPVRLGRNPFFSQTCPVSR
jgi:hypothetical protein